MAERRDDLTEDEREKGWVLLHRAICDHFCYSDPMRFWAFIDLMFRARYRTVRTVWNGKRVIVPRGAFCTSTRILARAWMPQGFTHWKVRNILDEMAAHDEIIRPTQACPLLTVVNYEKYQCLPGDDRTAKRADSAQTPRSGRTVAAHPPHTKEVRGKEVKEGETQQLAARAYAAHVYQAFRKAGGGAPGRPPASWEVEKLQAAVAAFDGDWEALAAVVARVTSGAVARGDRPRRVTYCQRAWDEELEARKYSGPVDPRVAEIVAGVEVGSMAHAGAHDRPKDAPPAFVAPRYDGAAAIVRAMRKRNGLDEIEEGE